MKNEPSTLQRYIFVESHNILHRIHNLSPLKTLPKRSPLVPPSLPQIKKNFEKIMGKCLLMLICGGVDLELKDIVKPPYMLMLFIYRIVLFITPSPPSNALFC